MHDEPGHQKTATDEASTTPPLLTIENLSVAYGSVLALSGVNMELAAGQLVGVIGPNGAGKSSLLKAILNMTPIQGRVLVGGRPLTAVRERVAYVPQRSEVRWDFPVTVEDVVMMGRYKRIGWVKFPTRQDKEIVAQSLEQVGMTALRPRQISQLSGGQQQRVFMARALAQQGDIMLLDEPLTGVDTTSQEVIMRLLQELRSAGKLIIMATHDLNAAARECDLCACINHRLIALGTPKEIFRPDILAETYGGKVLLIGGSDDNATNPTTLLVQ